jgi:hypothetical protein
MLFKLHSLVNIDMSFLYSSETNEFEVKVKEFNTKSIRYFEKLDMFYADKKNYGVFFELPYALRITVGMIMELYNSLTVHSKRV